MQKLGKGYKRLMKIIDNRNLVLKKNIITGLVMM